MNPRYKRNIPALTENECEILLKKRVLVIGCGGLGGHLIDMLARIGVGALRVIDGDVFEWSNLNRQLLSEVPLLGVNKAQAAADRIARINPEMEVEAMDCFLTEDNVHELIMHCDVVMDGLDNVKSRRIVEKECELAGIPYVYGAVDGWVAQAAVSMPGDHLIEALYPVDAMPKNKTVLSFTPALCAAIQVSLCVRLLTGRPVKNGDLYYYDLLNQEFETISININ